MSAPSSSYPRSVFTDSSAYYALSDVNETNHRIAQTIQLRLVQARSLVLTSNFIIDETYTLLLARLGYRIAVAFLSQVRQSNTIIVRLISEDEERAEEILRQYSDKAFSYTDATSFAVMERLDIEAAFSFDRDYRQYGLSVLLL
jgi:predicted nucleic acid-binding protein